MHHPTAYPHQVTREDLRIPLADGTELFARVWRPVTPEPVPALLEYLPDRLTDRTAPHDAERHPWYAGHGYAGLRVDARGHGNSTGVPGDEAQQLADAVAAVHWLAGQPWCDGAVGVFGFGTGGDLALRIAAAAPEPVKAVVTVCASDDPYENGGYYLGGSVLPAALPGRATGRLARAALPPDPKYVGEAWRPRWLERLAALTPVLHTWLGHQSRDGYWQRAAVDLDAITAPVLAVGGWAEPSRDTVLRLVERLAAPVRGIIGPWAHHHPDGEQPPGPAIGLLPETLRWWDRFLRGRETGVLDEPKLRCWLGESVRPVPGYTERPGRWIGDDQWPSDDVREIHYDLSEALRTAGTPADERFVLVRSPQQTGLDAGAYRPTGSAADLPTDQRAEDGRSVCFDSAPLAERLELLGRPGLRLRLRLPAGATRGQVVARLCDVAPDGSATLVTRGALNLAARRGAELTLDWEPGAVEEVAFELASTGYAFPPGHRVRLALSSAYWPWLWPQPTAAGFLVDPGHSTVVLPVRHLAADVGRGPIAFAPPERAAPAAVRRAAPGTARPERLQLREVAGGLRRLELAPVASLLTLPDGLVISEEASESYTVEERDPLSAVCRAEWTVRLERPDQGWDALVRTATTLTCGAAGFTARTELTAWEGGAVLFEREWERTVPRTAG
ncbi:CocE/NonD family hydrolase [Kitasatospora sp. NPDC058965]|uniref:CocE/NonD family hydrolase n=1 Tax=Kitasatospora sp. NPDC058965 TaxID=3346682 RepID=UPI00369D6558